MFDEALIEGELSLLCKRTVLYTIVSISHTSYNNYFYYYNLLAAESI
jgi:hypothetical protein